MKKSKLTLWIAATIIAYFFCNGLLATEKLDTSLTVTQWCNTFEAVDKIIQDFERPTA